MMVADTLRDFLENGNVRHCVNFPEARAAARPALRASRSRTTTCRTWSARSRPALAAAKLNIADLLNKSRGDLAYTLIDTDAEIPEAVLHRIRAIPGVLAARIV